MNEIFMREALNEAKKAYDLDELPVGAIVVYNNKIIARAHNEKEKSVNPLNHAEVIAIKKAIKKIGDWRLNECLLFVNLEPCVMCMGLILETRINKIYCSTRNNKYEKSLDAIIKNNNINIEYGIFEEDSRNLLKKFFSSKRN
jgi:tRNA(adenine34) deaminase